MIFNPGYGKAGLLVLPFYLVFELVSAVVELLAGAGRRERRIPAASCLVAAARAGRSRAAQQACLGRRTWRGVPERCGARSAREGTARPGTVTGTGEHAAQERAAANRG
jgi:hypothetical protein